MIEKIIEIDRYKDRLEKSGNFKDVRVKNSSLRILKAVVFRILIVLSQLICV